MTLYYQKSNKLPKTNGQRKVHDIVKVAQDVHAHFCVSSVQIESQKPKAPRKADPLTHVHRIQLLTEQAQKVYSCYEAGPTGFALHRQLTALGVENIVVAPTRLDERGRKVNTDKSDTLYLANKLDRYVAGNKDALTVVRVPSQEEEQRRAWTRQRQQLQEQRLSVATQGRSLALTQGLSLTNEWWKPHAWSHHQKTLPTWIVEHLMIFHRVINAVDEELRAIDKRLAAQTEYRAEARPKWLGGLSLETIEAEVCDWTRFNSWRKVGCFAGLTGGVSASGQSHRDLSITKVGNRRLRKALIETAWRFCRHQGGYWLTKKWEHILGTGASAHRRLRKK